MIQKDYGSMTVDQLARDAKSIEEVSAALKSVFWPVMEKMLQAEMEDHLWYEKHSRKWWNSWNSRNWSYKKKIITTSWTADIDVPRDRNWDFEPTILPKYEARTSEVEQKIINMYALGLTTTDIQDNIKDIYWAEISPTLISSITDKVIPEIKEWQARPLEKCYPIIYLDAIHFKVKDWGIYKEKAVYTVLWITIWWMKELLWLYVWGAESSSFWQTVCADLSQRWIQDIFIACVDWLSWFSNAIKNIFPQTTVQKCVIHQIRNSLKHVSYKDYKEFVKDLKAIYQAPNLEVAEQNLLVLDEKRWKKYGLAVKSRLNNWSELSTYFAYPWTIRKLIYTTNIIEWFHRQIRKSTKNRPTFPHETALMKVLYLVTQRVIKKWTTTIHGWWSILNQFDAIFDWRIKTYIDL